jgi:hypothetical protein
MFQRPPPSDGKVKAPQHVGGSTFKVRTKHQAPNTKHQAPSATAGTIRASGMLLRPKCRRLHQQEMLVELTMHFCEIATHT